MSAEHSGESKLEEPVDQPAPLKLSDDQRPRLAEVLFAKQSDVSLAGCIPRSFSGAAIMAMSVKPVHVGAWAYTIRPNCCG